MTAGAAVTPVGEVPTSDPPGYTNPEWREAFPWLVQGITARGSGAEPFDLGPFSDGSSSRAVLARWDRLRAATDLAGAVLAPQVHGAAVRFHRTGPPGLLLSEACDGHATADPGVLLAVTVADCVPVSVVDPRRRTVALAHAGWRGVAAGVAERSIAVLSERTGARPPDLRVHLGPAICGECYEVGPEVFEALGRSPPPGPAPLDLRAVVAERILAAGVPAAHVSRSALCTRCGDARLFSHRGGHAGRQVAYLGIRP